MVDDMTATPPDAAAGFLEDWHKSTTSTVHVFQKEAGPYKKVELHNFKFLGNQFQANHYVGKKEGVEVPGTQHTGAGVCAEFRDVLFDAQRRIFRSYAAEVRSSGGEPNESGFAKWCGVGVLSGWQFRSRQHSKGSAIDLDAKFNPYVPTGRVAATEASLGGEHHSKLDSGEHHKFRGAALRTYSNAYSLVYGKDMPAAAMTNVPSDATGPAFDAMLKVHFAVIVYSQLAFLMTRDDMLKRDFGFSRSFGPESDPGSFLATLKRFRPLLKGTPNPNLRVQYDTIRDDYEKLRLGMVYGSLVKASPGHSRKRTVI